MKHDRDMLAEHGTELMVLKASSVLAAAEADMRRALRNMGMEPSTAGRQHEGYEHYAFHRKHVRKAIDVCDLLVRALMDPIPGLESGKYNTRLIYGDGNRLRAAILLAKDRLVDRDCAMLDGTCDCKREEGQNFPDCKRHS